MPEPPTWVSDAVSAFGVACKEKLAGPGEKEAAVRAPIEQLLGGVRDALHLKAVFYDEVPDEDRRVRPDYGVSIDGAISGYVEVKAPGRGIDPTGFKGHDLKQWERQQDLPNLRYTNGKEWRLFRDSEQVGDPVQLSGGSLAKAGTKLEAPAGDRHPTRRVAEADRPIRRRWTNSASRQAKPSANGEVAGGSDRSTSKSPLSSPVCRHVGRRC